MTTYNFTTWDRMMITQVIGSTEGDVRVMRKAGKILDAVEMTEAEQAEVNMKMEGKLTAWNDPDREWPIELNDPDSVVLLREKVSAHKWLGAQHKQVIRLCKVLGIE